MKKSLKIVLAIFTVSLMFSSCNKEVAPDQQLNSQVTHELGALLLPETEYQLLPVAQIPAEFRLKALATSVTLNTPPVGDQGGEGSCVAWGTAYAGRSAQWQKDHIAAWSQSVNIFSPEYVYNQIKVKGNCGAGAYVTTGLNLLVSQGVCTWTAMPYTDVSCKTLPNTVQKTQAKNYKLSSYGKVSVDVNTLKTWLSNGYPIVVGGSVDRAFMYLANGAVLGNRSGSLGGHCYCLVGYDDSKSAFKFQNSWGTSWASSGFGWISYTSIKTWWSEAYVLNN
jgi:C1A family cysteine protease